MIINSFEAYNWFVHAKIKGSFYEWLDSLDSQKNMYNVPDCDSDKLFCKWISARKSPRQFFKEWLAANNH